MVHQGWLSSSTSVRATHFSNAWAITTKMIPPVANATPYPIRLLIIMSPSTPAVAAPPVSVKIVSTRKVVETGIPNRVSTKRASGGSTCHHWMPVSGNGMRLRRP